MLPTQGIFYFRVLILVFALINAGLIIDYWVYCNKIGFKNEIAWDLPVGHAVSLILTPISAFVTFGTRPRWLSVNSRFYSLLLVAVVLLVAKSHNLYRYLKQHAEHNRVCSTASDDIIICRPEQKRLFSIVMGMNEVPCAFILAILVIAEAIVSLRKDKRAQDTSELLTAAQDLESSQSAQKA
ncbi:hypothetical protein EC957_005561 [Mortierella hygrophila]|uniref:Uncharacterized protein n=1 Tax=Mortierella hygrophila TaxID=979708 RepID=A0A9P6JZM4_9FUNG|nr:hypothetical protein EC957_005561 [Mortierella hygrophila]